MGECLTRRGPLACLAHQRRPDWAEWYTSPEPWEVEQREAAIAQAKIEVQKAEDLITITYEGLRAGHVADASEAEAALAQAEEHLEEVSQDLNYPVNTCFF